MLTHDYTFRSGDTFYGDWIAVVIGGTPIDLSSGWQVRAQVRDTRSETKLFDLSTQLGTASIPLNGDQVTVSTVRIHIPAGASGTEGPFTGVWDMEIVHPTFDNGSLYRRTVDGGVLKSRRDVTRD